jgi:hypothetical protein
MASSDLGPLRRLENGEIQWQDAKWTPFGTIECSVTHHADNELVCFNATPYDEEAYGVELFNMLSTTYQSEVVACSDQEIYDYNASEVRSKRDQLLRECDWTQYPDVPEATRNLWTAYRQALRDISQQAGFPSTIVWPIGPS